MGASQVVPVEPTDEMVHAMAEAIRDQSCGDWQVEDWERDEMIAIWRAVLAAAPALPVRPKG